MGTARGDVRVPVATSAARAAARGARASWYTNPYATYGSSGTVWHYFLDYRVVNTTNGVTIVSTSASSTASDYSYGGGS